MTVLVHNMSQIVSCFILVKRHWLLSFLDQFIFPLQLRMQHGEMKQNRSFHYRQKRIPEPWKKDEE